MADIASLGIRVSSEGIPQAEQSLKNLAQTGAVVEKRAQKVAAEFGTSLNVAYRVLRGVAWREAA